MENPTVPYTSRDISATQAGGLSIDDGMIRPPSVDIAYHPEKVKDPNQQARHDQITALSGALLGAAHSVSPIPIAGTTLGGGVAAGGLGALNVQDIILTIERPIRYQPYDYSKLIGYPTDKAVKLGSIEGFAVIDKCHLRCEATLKEQELILEHFRQGVIF